MRLPVLGGPPSELYAAPLVIRPKQVVERGRGSRSIVAVYGHHVVVRHELSKVAGRAAIAQGVLLSKDVLPANSTIIGREIVEKVGRERVAVAGDNLVRQPDYLRGLTV